MDKTIKRTPDGKPERRTLTRLAITSQNLATISTTIPLESPIQIHLIHSCLVLTHLPNSINLISK